jgi:hypothetical protein
MAGISKTPWFEPGGAHIFHFWLGIKKIMPAHIYSNPRRGANGVGPLRQAGSDGCLHRQLGSTF